MFVCDRAKLLEIGSRMADTIASEKEYLTELDSKIGDADHGINLNRGFEAVRGKIKTMESACIGTILKTVGMTLLSTVGGASGPLYGTAFMDAGMRMMGKEELTPEDVDAIFQAAMDGVVRRGKAKIGEKTMLDTLGPVVAYCNENPWKPGEDWEKRKAEILARAKQGMESTRPLLALKGRASFLKERSVGQLDPGSVSCYMLIKASFDAD